MQDLGEQHFAREVTLFYMLVMLLPSFAYGWLQRVIRRTVRKINLASLLYAAGIGIAIVSPAAGLGARLADGPLDRLFER